MTKGRPTATSTAPMIHRNKVADKILASDIVIPALISQRFSPTLNSSWPIIILTRLFRYMIRAVSANVSTNEILVMPAATTALMSIKLNQFMLAQITDYEMHFHTALKSFIALGDRPDSSPYTLIRLRCDLKALRSCFQR